MLLKSESVTTWVALVVSLSMAVTVFLAKLVGGTLPLLAKKLGFDPAVMASPIITTIVDFLSLLVYFAFATRNARHRIKNRPLHIMCSGFLCKNGKKQTQLVGAGLCSARRKTLRSRENLRQIRMQLPTWL